MARGGVGMYMYMGDICMHVHCTSCMGDREVQCNNDGFKVSMEEGSAS